jgi:hypothetical protein
MSLVAFVSGRSPGLTTAVHALTLSWPQPRHALLAELDPDGGSLGARHELSPEPGLTSLAAAGRRGLAPDVVWQHCRQLRDGTIVLLAPIAPGLAGSALSVLGSRLAVTLDTIPDTDVLADCGRIDAASPAVALIQSARYVVLVVTPTIEGVAHAQARLDSLDLGAAPAPMASRLAVLTIGTRPYGPDEVAGVLGLPSLGVLADDQRGARELAEGRAGPGRRSELMRSAAVVADKLAIHLAAPDLEADRLEGTRP